MKKITLFFLAISTAISLFSQPTFTENAFATGLTGIINTYPIDMDGDNDIDVVGVGFLANGLVWWENDGTQTFTQHIIGGTFGYKNIHPIDIDEDGDIDLITNNHNDNEVAWWKNDGTQTFTKQIIDNSFGGAWKVFSADIDSDGDLDILGAANTDDDITWWKNDGSENFTKITIEGNFDGAYDVYAIDIDGDDDIDVLGAANTDDDVTWWENDGSENFTKNTIDASFNGANHVYAIDVDRDGDIDVLGTADTDDDIVWWENDGSESFTKNTIDASFNGARSVYASDVDNDGDIDVLGTANTANDIVWWENDGSQTFTKHTLDNNFYGANSVFTSDIDGDGDTDILGTAESTGGISWWENGLTDQILDFDGTDDYVSLGDINELENISQLTVTGWFYFDGVSNNTRLISNQSTPSTDAGWSISFGGSSTGESDDIRFIHNVNNSSKGDVYTDGYGLTTGHWYHIAVTFDGTQSTVADRVNIYINGQIQTNNYNGSNAPSILPITASPLVLGARSDGSGNFFQGNMDEISFWTTALDQTSIRNIMHTSISDTTNLEAYYRFYTETGAPTFADHSGKGHTGTWNGSSSGTNTTSNLETETQPKTNSDINIIRGLWSAIGTDNTIRSEGMRISTSTALTGTNRAVWGHDNGTGAVLTDDLSSSAVMSRFDRIWKVEESGTVSNVVFEFDLGSISGSTITTGTASDYVLLYRVGTSGDFTDVATGNSITSTDRVRFTGIAIQNGYYTIGTSDDATSPLPIEMLSFTGQLLDNQVLLNWQTATEINNSHFDIEWSTDGFNFALNSSSVSWKKIGEVAGAGTTNKIQEYSFLHTSPSNGENYYRLRQVDFDGKYEYSKVILIEWNNEIMHQWSIHSNPVSNHLIISTNQRSLLQLFDSLGRLVLEQSIGTFENIDISTIPNGIYFVKIGNDIQKLIVRK